MDSKDQIIMGVWAVIAERGLTAVSMRSVASAAGVSVGRVQHHFRTKEALIHESCRRMITMADEQTDDAAPPAERLAFAVGHSIPAEGRPAHGLAVWYSYVAQAVADPELGEILASGKRGQEKEVAALLAELGHNEPTGRARALIAVVDGVVQRVLIGDLGPGPAREVVERALAASL